MNYPFRQNASLKRLISLALAMLLTISLLSGCSLLPSRQTTEPSSDPVVESDPSDTEPSGLIDDNPVDPSPAPPTEPPTEAKKENIAIVKEQINLRAAPSTGSRVITQLDAGEEVEVVRIEPIGTKLVWAYISCDTLNVMGWVLTDMLDMSNVTLSYGSTETPGSSTSDPTVPTEATTPTDPSTPVVDPITGTGPTVNPANAKMGVVTASDLNIRNSASQNGDRVGSYTYGDRVAILETSNGWGRTDKGWISLSYVYMDGNTGTNTATGTVAATQLNVRSGPGTNYDKVTTLNQNARVQILEQIKVGTETWGYTNGGWVSMQFINVDGATNNPVGGNTGTTAGTGTATVTGSGLNIRAGAGTNYQIVGSLNQGEVVTILETTFADNMQWGRIYQGWISMTYVQMN